MGVCRLLKYTILFYYNTHPTHFLLVTPLPPLPVYLDEFCEILCICLSVVFGLIVR